jgi:hypothetical protein
VAMSELMASAATIETKSEGTGRHQPSMALSRLIGDDRGLVED